VVAVTNKYSVSYENNRQLFQDITKSMCVAELAESGACGSSYKNVGGGGKYR
jgi:hypothetical protein